MSERMVPVFAAKGYLLQPQFVRDRMTSIPHEESGESLVKATAEQKLLDRLYHPNDPGTAQAQGRQHDHDYHAHPEQDGPWGEESGCRTVAHLIQPV